MDLRQFRNVIAVMDNGSLGKAAEALRISQPALTKSIQRLEQQLGVPLFSRDVRGMRPTVYGECLRAHAQAVTIGVGQALLEINALKAGSTGVLNIAAPPLVASEILAESVVRLMQERPNLQVRVVTSAIDLTPGLLSGAHDFIVTVLQGKLPEPGLQQRLLFDDRLVMITRPDHPVTRLPRVSPGDLLGYNWVLPPPGNFHRRRLESLFEAAGLPPPRPAIECSSTPFIKTVVMHSDHIGLVAKIGITHPEAPRQLAVIELPSQFMIRPIGLIWREHHVLSPSSLLLIRAIESVCREKAAAMAGVA